MLCAFININLGLIAHPFYAYTCAFMIGAISSLIDILLFQNKIKDKAFCIFN